ncbi:hypothetical protein Fot_08123 [Forsythia ovata]|uniref:Uncharacterized protein n=1 Tax=Forsythia ovata TaxID=205694 RepID=A0ABD1WXR8_9LAMI
MEREFTHQGGPTHSGLTESQEGGPTHSDPTESQEGGLTPSGPTESQEGGPTYNRSYTTSMQRGFPHQRGTTPSDPTESHEGGPTYNRSYPTSIEMEFHRQGCPTQLPRVRCYRTSTKKDTVVQEVLSQYIRSYLDISGLT